MKSFILFVFIVISFSGGQVLCDSKDTFIESKSNGDTAITELQSNSRVESSSDFNSRQSWFAIALSHIKDIVQIVFFITIAVVTVLTFIAAKKTLLQPIKTVIFKKQLDELAHIVNNFYGKEEVELRDNFGFDELFSANCTHLVDRFAEAFFDIKFHPDKRPYNKFACPQSILEKEAFENEFVVLKGDYQIQDQVALPSQSQLKANWEKNPIGGTIHLPKKYIDMLEELRKLRHPLLPESVSILINDYIKHVEENVTLLRNTLKSCAIDFPQKYPTLEKLNEMSFSRIRNKYLNSFKALKPKADEIISELRNYLDVDSLLKPKFFHTKSKRGIRK